MNMSLAQKNDRRSVNRRMFWRVLSRSVFANRERLIVILLALEQAPAITAALLNLQVDAKRRITTEFRAFVPTFSSHRAPSNTLNDPILSELQSAPRTQVTWQRLFCTSLQSNSGDTASQRMLSSQDTSGFIGKPGAWRKLEPEHPSDYSQDECLAGLKLADRLKTSCPGQTVQLDME